MIAMTRRGRGVRAVLRALTIAALSFFALLPSAVAGPGHAGDEGHAHGPGAAASAQSPRVTATSEAFQLVGILKGGKLMLYLDREADNAPVTDAKITFNSGKETTAATANKDGTFEIPAGGEWTKAGEHEMQFTIVAAGKTDLVAGVLIVPDTARVAAAAPQSRWAKMQAHLPAPRLMGAGVLLLGFGMVLGGLVARRRAVAALAIVAVVAASMTSAPQAMAGPGHAGDEGHAHGPEAGAGLSDQASRLPDGSVFLPKPAQRLLEVRTRTAATESGRRAIRLPGRVIAGPKGSFVEVALYDQLAPEQIRSAFAIGPGNSKVEIKLAGRSNELKQNALMLQFALPADAPAVLATPGQRVSVMVEAGEPVSGVILPRAAIVTAPNGQAVVFEHTEPEKFTPKGVLFSAIDPDRVVVTSGIAAGEKIVVEAASLINQVR